MTWVQHPQPASSSQESCGGNKTQFEDYVYLGKNASLYKVKSGR